MLIIARRMAGFVAAAGLVLGMMALGARAADVVAGGPAPKQEDLIKILTSAESGKPEKAIACKQLSVWGDKTAVPALAPLLLDPELTSWARIAIEAITDPAADDALRDAAGKAKGLTLVGILNSIGVRRDTKAVDLLISKLADGDEAVASAAAVALGRIGGDAAAAALEKGLTTGAAAVRSASAEGAVLIAEKLLAAGQAERAVKLYDAVRATADLPKGRILESTRGAILARKSAGIPLLAEQLRSPDREIFRIALRTARELQGADVADALIAELARATPDRQSLLILVLADRPTDAGKVLPVVTEAAKGGAPAVRVTAVTVLERLGNVASVPVLLDAASSEDAELAAAGRTSLSRLLGKDIDADLMGRLRTAQGRSRRVLIELAETRRIEGSMAEFIRALEDPDAAVRTAALDAIGANGDDKNVPEILRLLAKAPEADRPALEKALTTISGRWGAACVPALVAAVKSGEPHSRIAGLHALSGTGGAEALAALSAATADADESVQDEAVRTLATWPNRWPEDTAATDSLLGLAKNGKKPAHKVLALRGYLQFLMGTKKLGDGPRLEKVKAALPLAERPEEKRLAVSALTAIGNAGALEALVTLAGDTTVADEACAAIVTVATKQNRGIPAAQRKAALETAAAKAASDQIKASAREAAKRVK